MSSASAFATDQGSTTNGGVEDVRHIAQFGPVRLGRQAAVAVIEIDNQPVNATSQAVRAGLLAAVEAAERDPETGAVVIACAGRTFTAGGDISEFGKTPLLPHLPVVLNRIEAATKPVVVAWHGTALGGGCEIGLAAHARVMAADARIGLPEVRLGLCPGAGGTQRLPRLCGVVTAIDLATSGRMMAAEDALKSGIVDEIAHGDLRAAALARATAMIGAPLRRTGEIPVPDSPPDAVAAAEARARKEARGRIAPERIIGLIRRAGIVPFAEGLAEERATFFELMATDQSRALRHVFFAEREVGKIRDIEGVNARPISRIGVIGAGTMGAGIAVALLDAGYPVTIIETDVAALERGRDRIGALYDRMLASGRLTAEDRALRLSGATFSAELADLAQVDLVIEAVFEDMAVKKGLLVRLEAVTRADVILATNTSYLDLNEMAGVLARPQNLVGLHFFSPAHVMKLLEIVRAKRTAPDVLASAVTLGRRLKKVAVVSGVCDGFIGNRILAKYRAQCEFMLEEGALPQEIDTALETYGFPMGPFAVQDLAGLDIAWARRKRLAPTRLPDERYVPLADRLCELGRFGQKTGSGWYRYEGGKRLVDQAVTDLILEHSRAIGMERRQITPQEIQARALAAMVNEGARIVAEGIACRPLDIDIVMINGYGYPAWRGGPMHEADRIGLPAILKTLKPMQTRDGPAFEASALLVEIAAEGGTLAQLNIRG